ncbi:MAG: T9SS type A sorting domain-containing protein [Bacteroidetes bacterium]|nr:T9SS type A sorting domain-containing protein [Bacteroidota bacterium]
MPPQAFLDQEFMVAVDGSVIGHGGGMAGLVVQVPEGFEFVGASYITASARRALRRNSNIAARYKAEKGHVVIALGDSIPTSRETDADVRVLLRFIPKEAGTFTFKFVTGVVAEHNGRLVWRSTDPPDLRDFAEMQEERLTRSVQVVYAERNGTAAIELAGNRQHLLCPDSGLFRLALERDFTIETWCTTTSLDAPLLSSRPDDFNTAYPFELRVSPWGEAQLRCADGHHSWTSGRGPFIADGSWHHLAVSWCTDSLRFMLFVDGHAADTLQVPAEMRGVAAQQLLLGTNIPRTQFARASFDEFRLWETCRNEQEVAYYRDLALSGYETNLYVLFSFDNGIDGRIPGQSQLDSLWLFAYNNPRLVVSTTPLRIELLAFSAVQDGDSVRMSWETYDESKVRGYEVEKRLESGRYAVLQHIEPMRTVERHQVYSVTDTWRGREIAYYRLRKINTDGTVLFSDEVPIGTETILNFSLEDNIPNPFTETTEIHYTLSKRTRVDLSVYDIMGSEISVLVAERQEAGSYVVSFDGRDLPGGMYFYKMRTSTGSQTKKMYLAK